MDYKDLCAQVQEIARSAGDFIRREGAKISEKDIKLKSVANLVTYVDKTSEEKIVKELSSLLPGSGFITEEGTASHHEEEYKWIIDPLDGTTNFVHGITPHAVSIALMRKNKLVMGVVYEVGLREMFFAWEGSPAYLNKDEIRVSSTGNLEDALIATGFPYYAFNRMDDYMKALVFLMQQTRGIRRLGSAATDLAYVAAGRFDAFFEHALHAWDVAAAAFILERAGGKISDFNGGDNWLFGGEIVASNHNLFDKFFSGLHASLGDHSSQT